MNDFSLIEKIQLLMELISSSSLFLICSVIGIILLIVFIICILLNKKINKFVFISILILISFLLLINYGNIIIKIIDILIDSVFMALYFPSLSTYISVVIFSNILFVISIFNKKQIKVVKITNIINSILLDILLILIIDVVSKNNINIHEQVSLYTNSNLLVLLELSMGIFTSWILVSLFVSAYQKLKKYDINTYDKLPEIIFDDI